MRREWISCYVYKTHKRHIKGKDGHFLKVITKYIFLMPLSMAWIYTFIFYLFTDAGYRAKVLKIIKHISIYWNISFLYVNNTTTAYEKCIFVRQNLYFTIRVETHIKYSTNVMMMMMMSECISYTSEIDFRMCFWCSNGIFVFCDPNANFWMFWSTISQ